MDRSREAERLRLRETSGSPGAIRKRNHWHVDVEVAVDVDVEVDVVVDVAVDVAVDVDVGIMVCSHVMD